MSRASLTVECGKLEKIIFARNREIAERDASIERLKRRIDVLESVRSAARAYWMAHPEYERQRLDHALAAVEDKR